ncbi:MAG TPA: TerD family protein [Methylomusa anaerophila]|uniref:General stress protein 16U n=1 Tax=Methylomusa anaerophila TaxID=1930071 RepID=A0A348AK63_9FIRM|nr:TerD family protein [Methylomusa anaerophila]BBB91461.1 general stress protein 16U [Methylomusa anaerophila]HML89949.1 TerD family protein [Methylomusa anaerophila]
MSINLSKGERINLSKEAPGLKKVGVGLGWDTNTTDTGVDFDLDASVFLVGANGKIPSEKYFVFYNNLTSPDGAVKHTGDNRTGQGDGDDETILVDIPKLDGNIQDLIFVVTIHEATARKQNFGQVRNAFIRLYNEENGKEVAKYELNEDFSRETALEFGRLYKKDGEWRFQAVGQGYNTGLQGFVDKYYE